MHNDWEVSAQGHHRIVEFPNGVPNEWVKSAEQVIDLFSVDCSIETTGNAVVFKFPKHCDNKEFSFLLAETEEKEGYRIHTPQKKEPIASEPEHKTLSKEQKLKRALEKKSALEKYYAQQQNHSVSQTKGHSLENTGTAETMHNDWQISAQGHHRIVKFPNGVPNEWVKSAEKIAIGIHAIDCDIEKTDNGVVFKFQEHCNNGRFSLLLSEIEKRQSRRVSARKRNAEEKISIANELESKAPSKGTSCEYN